MRLATKLRIGIGAVLFLTSEVFLLGGAEGVQKAFWIGGGTISNAILTIGFIIL